MHIYISLGSEYTNLPQIIIPCKERAIFWNPYFPFLSVHCIYFCIFPLVLTFNSNVGKLMRAGQLLNRRHHLMGARLHLSITIHHQSAQPFHSFQVSFQSKCWKTFKSWKTFKQKTLSKTNQII